ncbi:MAG: VWA domain-containing protein [Alphaproteobacteria bacterium]|nr:VWA domain-containing protein [Alphaproteobacteria bacterium]
MFVIAILAGCSNSPPTADGAHRLQRTRAGYTAEGSMLSTHLLLRDAAGQPLACGDGSLTVDVEVSTSGASGPWTSTAEDVQVRCADAASGDVAMVLDNSGSTADVVATLRGASSLLVDDVIDAGGRASLVRVSTNARVLHELTDDSQALVTSIVEGLNDDSNGWTALWDGVRMGNETFGGAVVHRDGAVVWDDLEDFCSASDRLGIVVFTDGHENNSADQQDYDHIRYPGDGYATTLEDLQSLHVAGQSTPIYTIGLGDTPDHAQLGRLADSTGGAHTAITEVAEIGPVFEQIGSWMQSTHQVCATLPETVCGTSHVRVTWSLRDASGSQIDHGSMVQGVTMDCPLPDPSGRTAVVLLTLTNPHLPPADVDRFAANTVDWVSPVAAPRVLVVLDDNHHGEFAGDADAIAAMLQGRGYDVARLDEPTHGITGADLAGFDVVWFSNPGYPPDDMGSIQALAAFAAAGGGLVLQGDDMTWTEGAGFSMEAITGLTHVDNGVQTCGHPTNDNLGDRFSLEVTNAHPLFAGLTQTTWLYGDDIDLSTPNGSSEVIAEAGLEGEPTCALRPAVAVIDP